VIHVRRTFTDGNVGAPKNHEKREVFITTEVVEMLGAWWGECGKPGDNTLVLPGETKTGYMDPQVVLRRVLYPVMKRAGLPRVGPTGEKRTFHSLRHTFARIAIEHNRPIFWLSKHLGHSTLDVTSNVYGHFEKATRRREAEAMAGGVWCLIADGLPVGGTLRSGLLRPRGRPGEHGVMPTRVPCQVALSAAVGVHDVDVGVAVAPANEGDLTPVPRPARLCADRALVDLSGVSRQPSRSAAVGVHHVYLEDRRSTASGASAVLSSCEPALEDDPLSVG
jgi:hypothetical protein